MNKKVKEKGFRRTMSRRSLVLGGAQLLLMSFLGGRLYQLQIAQNNRYQRLSDRNQFDMRVVTPQRGRVFDRKMRLLAGNAESYELQVTPLHAKNLPNVLAHLADIVDLPESDQLAVMEIARKQAKFRPITVRSDLTQRELSRLAIRSAYLPGVTFKKRLRRIYPQGALTGHITGYVSPITEGELDEDRTLRTMPDLDTGKIGVEQALEMELRGKAGNERVEVNARGMQVRVFKDVTRCRAKISNWPWISGYSCLQRRRCALEHWSRFRWRCQLYNVQSRLMRNCARILKPVMMLSYATPKAV